MLKTRCNTCVGSGKVMGGGMMMIDCDDCDGKGKIYTEEKKEFVIDKNSKHYKEAIKKIKSLNADMTDDQAGEIFESELNNIKDDDNVGEKNIGKK